MTLLFAGAFPQKASTPTPATPPATTNYHSDILRFDYTYSSSFTTETNAADEALKAEKDKSTGVMKAAIDCITLPLTATDSSNGFRMILIMRMDGACLGSTTPPSRLGAVTNSALTQSLKRFGDPQMGAPADYQVIGHPASTLSGSVKSEKYGLIFYGTASCLLQGSDVVCWEFLASDCSQLPALMANPIQFEGQPKAALIPETFTPPCQ
jgi:hypothetical protein